MSKTPISRSLQAEVFQRDGYRCRYCGSTDGPFELDHVYPEVKGGQTTADNLAVACKSCNRLKSDDIGMWPFPVGYFENPEKPIPQGEDRYWGYLWTACTEINHTLTVYKDASREYTIVAIGLFGKKKHERDEASTFMARRFISLENLISDLALRLESIRRNLDRAFPNRMKSFFLALTGQKPPMLDLLASESAMDGIQNETMDLIEKAKDLAKPFVLNDEYDSLPMLFVYSLAKPIEYLEDCAISISLAKDHLRQAQLSISSKK